LANKDGIQRKQIDFVKWGFLLLVLVGVIYVLLTEDRGAQYIVNGIRYGSILMLGAIGLTLTYRIMNFANFAHGDLITFGAYITFTYTALLGIPFILSAGLAIITTPFLAIATDRLVYKRLRLRKSAPVVAIMASFGIALILRNLIQGVWGTNIQNFGLLRARPRTYDFGILEFQLTDYGLIMMIAAFSLAFLLHLFLKHTRMGKAMRATSDNIDLAKTTGINTERITAWTWGIGTGLAVVAGVFLGVNSGVFNLMGAGILIQLFAAAILGGVGSPYGAMLGGLVVGIAMNILVEPVTPISPAYQPAVAFVLMILMLLVRPQGLLGIAERKG
jgi:branched-chain amino acid transport system permease protein/neutral amino acid transport system permease protein